MLGSSVIYHLVCLGQAEAKNFTSEHFMFKKVMLHFGPPLHINGIFTVCEQVLGVSVFQDAPSLYVQDVLLHHTKYTIN